MGLGSFSRWLLLSATIIVGSVVVSALLAQDNQGGATSRGLDELKLAFSQFKESIVKIEETVSTVSTTAPPVGGVVAYAGTIDQDHPLKSSWMLCNGRPLSKTDYPELFAAIGTNYGAGIDSTGLKLPQRDFNLPNYQGYFLRGTDPTKSVDKGPRSAGEVVGSHEDFATTLPTKPFTTDLQGQHTHTLNFETSASRNWGPGNMVKNTVANPSVGGALPSTGPAGQHQHTVTGGGDQETRPVNISVNWIIRVK
jgi:microcystin-dependent protein